MDMGKRVKIISTSGIGMGTKVIDTITGEDVPMVRSIKINIPLDDVITANLECLAPELDIAVGNIDYKIVGYNELVRQERTRFNNFLNGICWRIWSFIF